MSYKNNEIIDWATYSERVALALFGEPDEKNSGGKDWRWGGSKSLSIHVVKGVFTDHKTGDRGGIYDLIKRERGLSGPAAVEWLRKECPDLDLQFTTREAMEKRDAERRKEQEDDAQKKSKWAKDKWYAGQPLAGSVAETYLAGREISAPDGAFLRYASNLSHLKDAETGKYTHHPAMIGGVTVWPGSSIVAVHRTYLTPEGGKIGGKSAKMMLGAVGGGAVRLSAPAGGVSGGIVLCEGIETGLSLCAASDMAVWACLSASGIEKVVLPPADQVGRIMIAADNDKNRTGLKAAEAKAQKLRKAGYGVSIALPPEAGQDFNDLHRAQGIEAVKAMLSGAKSVESDPLPKLLNDAGWPFFANEKGVMHKAEKSDRDGEVTEEIRRLSSPIYVEAITQSGEGKDWGRLLCVVNNLGQKNRVILSAADISEGGRAGVFSTLSALGAIIPQSKGLRDKLLDYLIEARPEQHMICAERIGWHEASGAFVMPDESYGGAADVPVIYGPGSAGGNNPYQVRGTLEEWQREIAEPCRGNSRLVFSLCVACAGPFLRLVDGEGGVFHFSGASSIGKSTTLAVAGSFWGGGGLNGFRDTWRATDNALEYKALEHSDTLICLDELGQADAQAAQRSTYMLAQGSGKARMDQSGGRRDTLEWRFNGLSSGEIGMAEKLAEGRGTFALKDGQEARFVEIPADAGAGFGLFETLGQFDTAAALADHFKAATLKHYGAPGRALLEAIADDPQKYAEQAQKSVQIFRKKLAISGASAAVDRVAARFALVATAGAFAAKKGIIPFEPSEITDAVKACFQAWLQNRGGSGSREAYEAADRMAQFIQEHGKSRFQSWQRDPFENVQRRAGFRKPENEDGLTNETYYFLTRVFKSEILHGLNAKNCIDAMVADGYLAEKNGDAVMVMWVPSEGKSIRLYQATEKVFDAE